MTYMVKADTGFGMMMEQEFSADAGEDYDTQMDALYEQVTATAEKIEKSLAVFCPKAEVYLGRETGLDGCHELCVFVPADAMDYEIEQMIYVLTLIGKDEEPPYEKKALNSWQYSSFQKDNNYFSICGGFHPYYAKQPVVTIGFTDDCELTEFTVLVARKAMEEDGVLNADQGAGAAGAGYAQHQEICGRGREKCGTGCRDDSRPQHALSLCVGVSEAGLYHQL